ncbi:MAG: hypothetical protein OXT09_10685 [Myxococcales bacterium]|nr:hypothetical protein [Myxococcales bacterium]
MAIAAVVACACAAEDTVAPNVGSRDDGVATPGGPGTPGSTPGTGDTAGAPGDTANMDGPPGDVAGSPAAAGMTGGAAGSDGATQDATTPGDGDGVGDAPGDVMAATDADCDVSGLWAVRMMTVVQALGLEQCGNLYHYMELAQDGTDVTVVDHLSCGIEGRGSSTSSFSDATVLGLMRASSQIGRRGTMQKTADGSCRFEMEPYWFVLGADETLFAPDPRNADLTLASVQSSNPMPPPPAPGVVNLDVPGVIDIENDGFPGAAFVVTGAISGKRHAAQRGVHSWLTNDRYRITPATDWIDDIEVRADYIGEDLTYHVEGDPLLWAGALPVRDAASARVTMRFLGRDATDARVAEMVVSADPEADPDGAVQTCANIRAALPPIAPLTAPQVCPCPGGGMCM